MFMMRMCALKSWLMGMRLGVIPIELLLPAPNFVPIPVNDEWKPMIEHALTYYETHILFKV